MSFRRMLFVGFLIWGGPTAVAAGMVDVQAYQAYAAYKSGDYPKAHELWLEAAGRGSTTAMNNLANLYVHGQGVPRNLDTAADWYRRAAEAGDAVAQTHLGMAYETGQGVPRDNRKAAEWFRRAAEQGDVDAQHNLGVMLATNYGEGLESSSGEQLEEARHWLQKAREGGHPEAASLLSVLDAR